MALAPALGAGCGRERSPSAGREPREKEEGLAEKKPPLARAAPPTYSTAPFPERKGEDEEEEEKEREGGGVGELDIKIGWGDGGRFSVSPAAPFLPRRRRRQREEKRPQLRPPRVNSCRSGLAAAAAADGA